jgi:hypothetical protein
VRDASAGDGENRAVAGARDDAAEGVGPPILGKEHVPDRRFVNGDKGVISARENLQALAFVAHIFQFDKLTRALPILLRNLEFIEVWRDNGKSGPR